MGTSHSFECIKCKKYIIASMVETEGMNSKVLAIECSDCGEVSDSVIEVHRDWNNETVQQNPSCNECDSDNVVQWDGKCPICNIEMVDKGRFMLWD